MYLEDLMDHVNYGSWLYIKYDESDMFVFVDQYMSENDDIRRKLKPLLDREVDGIRPARMNNPNDPGKRINVLMVYLI